jgi:hypothetical protein
MSPHLVKWDKMYRSQGLTIIDVNNGKIDKQDVLAKYVKKQGKTYPTLWDKDGEVCKSYAVRGYPAAFLVGADGKVVWEGFPVPELGAVEKRIAKELTLVKKPEAKLPGQKTPRKEPKAGIKKAGKSKPKPEPKPKSKSKSKSKSKPKSKSGIIGK